MAEFEESRRAIRSSVVAAALAEGATVTEIGEIFGVSRQLANRFVKELRARMALSRRTAPPGPTSECRRRTAASTSRAVVGLLEVGRNPAGPDLTGGP